MGLDWTLWEELMGGLHICRMLPQGRGVAKGERKHVCISGVLVSISELVKEGGNIGCSGKMLSGARVSTTASFRLAT